MKQTKRVLNLMLCFLVAVLPSATAASMTYEEAVVRKAYAKLSYAVQLGAVHKAMKGRGPLNRVELDARLAKEDLRFELNNFSSGSIADIAERSIADLASRPSGEDVLDVQPNTLKYSESLRESLEVRETRENNATVSWKSGPMATEGWELTAGQVFAQMENSNWYPRYAAFTVRVSFEGRSRVYKAFFLFGKNDNGEEEVLVGDPVTSQSGLHFFVTNSVYPATLLETKLAAHPVVQDWLKSNQVSDIPCESGKRESCCNLTSLKCGVAPEDLRSAPSKPSAKVMPPLPSSYFSPVIRKGPLLEGSDA